MKLKKIYMSLLKKLKKIPNKIIIILIKIYRAILSPSVGILRFIPNYSKPSCVFYPTCSEYALICFEKYSFLIAFKKSITRIGKCHPGNEPKVDLP